MEAGRELDVLIATKVLGYAQPKYVYIGEPDYSEIDAWWYEDKDGAWEELPKYSVDMGAAWEVVERFKWPKFYVGLQRTDTGNWRCDIETHGGDGPTYSDYHKTAPMAICLAAIKVINTGIILG